MVKRVGKWVKSRYSRYVIPYRPEGGQEYVDKHTGEIFPSATSEKVKHRERRFRHVMGNDAAVRSVGRGVNLVNPKGGRIVLKIRAK